VWHAMSCLLPLFAVSQAQEIEGRGGMCRVGEAVLQFGGWRGGLFTRTWRFTVSLWNMAQISDLDVFAFRV
jgi:hypothetical protein